MALDVNKDKLKELLSEYVRANINRNHLIKHSCSYVNINSISKESQFYHLLEVVYGDPEDNSLLLYRKDLLKIIDTYINMKITLEEFQLWFWDVLTLNINGDDSEEKLISYILYTFDNLEINEINEIIIKKIQKILISTSDSDLALMKIKDTIR